MTERKRCNLFISDCGEFVALRIPGLQPAFDVWRHDGSELWEGAKYVKAPGTNGYNHSTLYMEDHARPKKIVGSWTNCGHEKRNGEWVEAFEVCLDNLDTKEGFNVSFHTQLQSLTPLYAKRREAQQANHKEEEQ